MSINLKNLVNVDIDYANKINYTNLDFSTAVFLAYVSTVTSFDTFTLTEANSDNLDDTQTKVYNAVKDYINHFFNNNGKKLKIVYLSNNNADTALTVIKSLKSNEIIVASNLDYNVMVNVSSNVNSELTGIDRKIILTETLNTNLETIPTNPYFAVKILGASSSATYDIGASMNMAAYLTQIDFTKANTVLDYMFTEESNTVALNDSDTTFNYVKNNNFNGVFNVANKYINIGGNCCDGNSLVNSFALIALQNTMTVKVYELLLKKLKYNSTSISRFSSVISDVLDDYITNGYIANQTAWSGNDIVIDDYILVEKGEVLYNGYKVYIGDYDSDKMESGTLPDIYVILTDSNGIRYINIKGYVA